MTTLINPTQDLHLNRAMLSVVKRLTWVVLPAASIDFQPQHTRSPGYILGVLGS